MSDIALQMLPAQPNYNDLQVVAGDLVIIDRADAIRQRLLQNLRLFLGEWFLDTSKGVPYYQFILVKNPNLDLVEATIKNVILKTEGMQELTKFEFGYDNSLRALSVTFEAKSTTGETIKLRTSVGV